LRWYKKEVLRIMTKQEFELKAIQWTVAEIDSLSINALERAFDAGHLDPLLINDGHIIGFEKAETPGAATPRESR
jgi:hypothetical protein